MVIDSSVYHKQKRKALLDLISSVNVTWWPYCPIGSPINPVSGPNQPQQNMLPKEHSLERTPQHLLRPHDKDRLHSLLIPSYMIWPARYMVAAATEFDEAFQHWSGKDITLLKPQYRTHSSTAGEMFPFRILKGSIWLYFIFCGDCIAVARSGKWLQYKAACL